MHLVGFIALNCVLFASVGSRHLERLKRNANRYEWAKWDNAEVPYVIDSLLSPKMFELFNKAVEEFNLYTCVKWRPKTENDSHWAVIMSDAEPFFEQDGKKEPKPCSAQVGRMPYSVELNRTNSVTLNEHHCPHIQSVLHEMMHTIGFHHEHTRLDRDEYVDVIPSLDNDFNYKKYNGSTYNLTYDVHSVMHYYFGKQMTLKKNASFSQLSNDFTPTDIKKINLHYNCTTANLQPVCTSEHFVLAPEKFVFAIDYVMNTRLFWYGSDGESAIQIQWVKKCVVNADKTLSLELGCVCDRQVYARNGLWFFCKRYWFKCQTEANLKAADDWKPLWSIYPPKDVETVKL